MLDLRRRCLSVRGCVDGDCSTATSDLPVVRRADVIRAGDSDEARATHSDINSIVGEGLMPTPDDTTVALMAATLWDKVHVDTGSSWAQVSDRERWRTREAVEMARAILAEVERTAPKPLSDVEAVRAMGGGICPTCHGYGSRMSARLPPCADCEGTGRISPSPPDAGGDQ